jgi:hypothetical protein
MFNFIHIPKNGGSSFEKICDNKIMTYRHHGFCPFENTIRNSIVVLREPEDRICSSIRYMFQKANSRTLNLKLNRCGIFNENDFLVSWCRRDSSFEHIKEVLKMYVDTQRVGSKRFDSNWVFLPQTVWFNNPHTIFTKKSLNEEFSVFSCKFNIRKKLPTLNVTRKTGTKLSDEALNFIKETYSEDYELWDYWSEKPLQERIEIDWSKHENFSNRP